jgi:predicted O-linked N-acetylglucosamine transferase (SPINDLY family)
MHEKPQTTPAPALPSAYELAETTRAKFIEALAFHQQGRLGAAQECCLQILALQPRHFESLHLLGVISAQTGHPERAVELISRAIDINPHAAAPYNNRGNALRALNQYVAAVESFDQAVALKPDYPDAYYNRAIALHDLKDYDAALQSYDKAIKLKPDYAEAYNNRGGLLRELQRYDAAVQSYDKAIVFKPDSEEAYYNRGNALCQLRSYDAALQSYDKAIYLKADHAEAYNGRGIVLNELKQYDAALQSFDKALTLKADYAEAHHNRGTSLLELRRFEAALRDYEKALALKPELQFLFGTHLHTKMHICEWAHAEAAFSQLTVNIERGKETAPPFAVLALSNSPTLQKSAAEIWLRAKCVPNIAVPKSLRFQKRDKIRLGYFSADFREHALSRLIAELFELHNRSTFEVTAFSLGPRRQDRLRARISAASDRFIDVANHSDLDVVTLARSLELDIAIDLTGFTQYARPHIFALRPAPVQVNYLGYPGTMGAHYIDYLIADPTLIPYGQQQHYAEKIVYLPNSYQANDSKRRMSDRNFTRVDFGLPETGFVFCCFNNNYKILPETFDSWMRILKRVEGSVLWLLPSNGTAADNLRREATARGVGVERLVYAGVMSPPDHLARHRVADLFLDTFPYNAHTTASDSLWSELPVLTCLGETFAGRVAASLLNAIGLPELITLTREEYEALAIDLATNPEKLKQIRLKLRHNRLTMPLFNTKLFTKHIEAAYTMMYDRYHAGLSPTHLHVPS